MSAVKQDNQKGLMQIKRIKNRNSDYFRFRYPQRKAADDDEILLLCRLNRSQRDGVDDIVNSAPRDRSLTGLRIPCSIGPMRSGRQNAVPLCRWCYRCSDREDEHGSATCNRRVRRFGFRTSAITAASYCSGPSIIRSGRFPAPDELLRELFLRRYLHQSTGGVGEHSNARFDTEGRSGSAD